MPDPAPLAMPVQDFSRIPPHRHAERPSATTRLWRSFCMGGGSLITVGLLSGLVYWMKVDGLTWLEISIAALVGMVFLWVAISACMALAGLIAPRPTPAAARLPEGVALRPMSVAILVPLYNEDPQMVMGNALAMLREIASRDTRHRFGLFFLSDTRGDGAEEARTFAVMRRLAPEGIPVYYRRRAQNTDRKTGNLHDWVTTWGGAWEGMMVLDADSLMGADTIIALADDMAADDTTGLIQSPPQLIGARSLFSRTQQFASSAYGPALSRGLSLVAGDASNFWGHNAIIRTRAFASAAGLPKIRGFGGTPQLIWSHDFVEAALLRRRGWKVTFRADLGESYEETPPSLIDYVLRDRRWCQGNLQHLKLLGIKGLHPMSRFHMLNGAVAYLLSLGWLALLITWTALGVTGGHGPWNYFSEASPLMVNWPKVSQVGSLPFALAIYGLLLVPKLVSLTATLCDSTLRRQFGGGARLISSAVLELALSILYAPCLMVQQSMMVIRGALGIKVGWVPQNREDGKHSLRELLVFHRLETAIGLLLLGAILMGVVTMWLLPIAVSLILAVPLSALSAKKVSDHVLSTPQDIEPRPIQISAREARRELAASMEGPMAMAAE